LNGISKVSPSNKKVFFFLREHGLRSRFVQAQDGDDVHQRGKRGCRHERPPVSPSLA
jgi:hypothetical protein